MTTLSLTRPGIGRHELDQPRPGRQDPPPAVRRPRPSRPESAADRRWNAATWRAVALALTMGLASAMLIVPAIVGGQPAQPVVEAGSAARTQLPVPPPRRMEIYPDPIGAMNGALPVP